MRELEDGDELSKSEAREMVKALIMGASGDKIQAHLAQAWLAGWLMCASGGKDHYNPFKARK